MKAHLLLIRHGQSIGNTLNQLQGWQDGYLTEEGLRQAGLVAEAIAGRRDVSALYSSPLRRARQTAEAIARRTGLPLTSDPGLREICFGNAEGLSVKELRETYPDTYLAWQKRDDLDFGWPGGETRRVFHKRIVDTMSRILGNHDGETISVVSHGGALAVYIAHLMTGSTMAWHKYILDNCSVTEIELNGSEPAKLISLNRCLHIPEGKKYDL